MTEHTMTNGSTLTMLPDGGATIGSKHQITELSAADVAAIRGPGLDVAKLLEWLGERASTQMTDMESAAYHRAAQHVRGMASDLRTLGKSNGWEDAALRARNPRVKSESHPLFLTEQSDDGRWTARTKRYHSPGHVTQEGAAAHSWTLARDAGASEPAPRVSELPEGARWDMGTLVLASGRRLRNMSGRVSLWNDAWHPDGTDACDYPRTVEEALAVAAVLARATTPISPGTCRGEGSTHVGPGVLPNPSPAPANLGGGAGEVLSVEKDPSGLDCGKPVAMGHGNDYQCERQAGHDGRCGELWEGQELGERALAAEAERLRAMPSGHVEPEPGLLDDLCEWLDHVDASGGMSELTAMGDGLVAAIRARYDGRNLGQLEPELSHCTACDKQTRFGTQQTCRECESMRLVDAPPEWLVDLEKLAPDRGHIGRWVLAQVKLYQAWESKMAASEERIDELEEAAMRAAEPARLQEKYDEGRDAMAREAVAFLNAATHEDGAAKPKSVCPAAIDFQGAKVGCRLFAGHGIPHVGPSKTHGDLSWVDDALDKLIREGQVR